MRGQLSRGDAIKFALAKMNFIQSISFKSKHYEKWIWLESQDKKNERGFFIANKFKDWVREGTSLNNSKASKELTRFLELFGQEWSRRDF